MHAQLCKFKGRLKPEEMAEDIVFAKDPDAMLYREHVFRRRVHPASAHAFQIAYKACTAMEGGNVLPLTGNPS